MKKIIFILVFLFVCLSAFARKINAVDIAKMYLFLNSSCISDSIWLYYHLEDVPFICSDKSSNDTVKKDDFTYTKFKNSFDIKLDTLRVSDENDFYDNDDDEDYDNYYSRLDSDWVSLEEWIDGDLKYTFYKIHIDNFTNEPPGIGWFMMIKYCVIAVQESTGRSYRIMGFDNNDFLSFLLDFRSQYAMVNNENISVEQILKYFKVECVDFECLYEGLTDKNWLRPDLCQYPCLWRINDMVPISYGLSEKCKKFFKKHKGSIIDKCNRR